MVRKRADGLPMNNIHPQKKTHPWHRQPACLTRRALKLDEFNDRKPMPDKRS